MFFIFTAVYGTVATMSNGLSRKRVSDLKDDSNIAYLKFHAYRMFS